MRIVVVNTAASTGGALSILDDFVDYIKANGKNIQWYFILSGHYVEETNNIKVIIPDKGKSRIERLKFDFYKGKKLIQKLAPDVVFSMQNTAILGLTTPQIVYLQQSIPFQKVKKFSFFKKNQISYAIYQYIIGNIIKRNLHKSDKVIVQTEWMKRSVIESTKVKNENIIVIPPTIEFKSQVKKNRIKENRFVYPSSNYLYKNIDLIDSAARIIDLNYPELEYDIDITITEKMENNRINTIGSIPRKQVLEKLSEEILIFPSYIETFGLPLAEARLCGTIILASDTEFSREVLKNYKNAYFFHPFKPEQLANLMIKCITKKITINEDNLSERHKSENSWSKVLTVLTKLR